MAKHTLLRRARHGGARRRLQSHRLRFGAAVCLLAWAPLSCRARWKAPAAKQQAEVAAPAEAAPETSSAPPPGSVSHPEQELKPDHPQLSTSSAAPRWNAASFAQAGFGEAPRGEGLVTAAALLALQRSPNEPPAVAAAGAVELLEGSSLTAAGTGSPKRGGDTAQLDALVQDSVAGFGSVTLFDGMYSPIDAALQLVKHPGFSVAGTSAFEQLGFTAKPLTQAALTPSGARDAGVSDQAATSLRGAVSVLLRTDDGRFAGALSHGGRADSLVGEMSPVTQPGVSLYCGPSGAISVTWADAVPPEPIARLAYEKLEDGSSANDVARWVFERWGKLGHLGIAVLTKDALGTQAHDNWVHASQSAGEQP